MTTIEVGGPCEDGRKMRFAHCQFRAVYGARAACTPHSGPHPKGMEHLALLLHTMSSFTSYHKWPSWLQDIPALFIHTLNLFIQVDSNIGQLSGDDIADAVLPV
eukprot:6228182-Amphidinium_carterae.1